LLEYKEGTLGHQYGKFLQEFGLNHDERPLVQHIGDIELAYVYQRYKEVHDLLHVVFGRGISVYDEIVVKWFEFAQSELASTALAAWFGPLRLTSAQISQLFAEDVPEVLRRAKQIHFFMEVYYEKYFDQDIEDFRRWFFQANR
jgi:ubiquinone biosynthesis protein COQ4